MEDLKGVAQPGLAQHDSSVLDLAFAMDCTGSMGSYIRNAQQNIRRIVEEIVGAERSDVRLALVQYRDHPPQDRSFVTDVLDLTASVSVMKNKLDSCSAKGGGDGPEAVADALHQVLKLSWRENATKICVLISDAPPHGLATQGDGFPNGCPDGLDPVRTTRELAEKGITLYAVGCEPSILKYKEFFSALAFITGGQYVPLGNANMLAKVIIGGAQEEVTLERLMHEVNQEVQQAALASGGIVDELELGSRITQQMQSRGVTSKRLRKNRADLVGSSVLAQGYAEMSSLSDIKVAYEKDMPYDKLARKRGASMAVTPGMMAGPPPQLLGGPPVCQPQMYMSGLIAGASSMGDPPLMGGLEAPDVLMMGAPPGAPPPQIPASFPAASMLCTNGRAMPVTPGAPLMQAMTPAPLMQAMTPSADMEMFDVHEDMVSAPQVQRMIKKSMQRQQIPSVKSESKS